MQNTFHKISKLIITFTAVLSSWTLALLFSNSAYNLEIKQVIYKMYLNQKYFILNVKDLSILLVKDANQRFSNNYQDNIQFEDVEN